MRKMDAFVDAMRVAFLLSKEVEGIERINWHIEYRGTTDSTEEIAKRINLAMKEAGLSLKEIES